MKKKINSKDVSVVMQGAIDNYTEDCLKSIRKYLPNSEIILSTWEGSDVSNLKGLYDKLLLNKDPGGYDYGHPTGRPLNINRMILSAKNGVKIAERKYILKIRTDQYLINDNILKINDKYKRNSEMKVFERRIIANDVYSYKYLRKQNGQKHYKPCHVSDWLFFGLTQDIQFLYDISLAKNPDYFHYFENHPIPQDRGFSEAEGNLLLQYAPEQYIQINCLRKKYEFNYDHYFDYNEKNIEQGEKYIVNNYLILPSEKTGIYNKKKDYKNFSRYNIYKIIEPKSLYSEYTWVKDYKKYIDNNYLFIKELSENSLSQLKYNINNIYRKIETIFAKLRTFVGGG